jgi:hypothetical protein
VDVNLLGNIMDTFRKTPPKPEVPAVTAKAPAAANDDDDGSDPGGGGKKPAKKPKKAPPKSGNPKNASA